MVKVTLEGLHATQIAHARRQDRMEHDMETLQNRLPSWATILLTVLGSTVTGLIVKMVG